MRFAYEDKQYFCGSKDIHYTHGLDNDRYIVRISRVPGGFYRNRYHGNGKFFAQIRDCKRKRLIKATGEVSAATARKEGIAFLRGYLSLIDILEEGEL